MSRISILKNTVAALCALLGLAACEEEVTRGCEPAPGTICTVAGSGRAGVSGDEGLAWRAKLYLPMDSTLGPDGNLYVVDWNNHRLRVVDDPLGENVISTCAGSGNLGDGPPGPALAADFNHPTDIVFDASGRLVIAAWHNSRIRRVDLTTSTMEDVAGTGGRAYAGDGGPAATAVLDLPAGIDFDAAGNLYFVDQANQVIRRITTDGTIERVAGQCIVDECAEGQTPVACPGASGKTMCGTDIASCTLPCRGGFDGDGGPALQARFSMPFGQSADPAGRIAIADDGTIYFADTHNHRIRVIAPDGTVGTLAGTGEQGYGGDGGAATAAMIDNPVDVEVSSDGTLYFTDTMNHCVRAVDLASGVIRTAVGQCGQRGFAGDGGDPTMALLDRPYGVDVDDATGNLYVTDTHNHRVRVVMPAAE
ncbi:MAG: hypothetical protein M3Y87_18465 [Myxococcota bacterium]|nr:hypothetical protein [Myxococcota bacterium]